MMIARLIGAYHATWLVGTPTFLDSITRAASVDDLSTITYAITGGEKCPDRLFDFIASKWPSFIIIEGYGITECSPIVSVNRENDPRKGTIGSAMPSVEYLLRDPETGLRVAPGGAGMLLVRGPSIFSGYLNYSGESPFEEFEGKTWYRTGDIVAEDKEGIFTFRGRLKRFVKLGGEMVSLPAIEEVLLTAFKREDEEIPLAVESTGPETSPEIVLFTTKSISREQANAAISAAGLSPIHNIRMVKTVDAIPLLGSGKTNYRELKKLL
jgi:long-chain-fatty-acid--[acyl-carrier-protein] ligase